MLIVTLPEYVPAAIRMVSPAAAASTAAWTEPLDELLGAGDRHVLVDEHAVHVGQPGLDGARGHGRHHVSGPLSCPLSGALSGGAAGPRCRRRGAPQDPAAEGLDDGADLAHPVHGLLAVLDGAALDLHADAQLPVLLAVQHQPHRPGAAAHDVGEQQVGDVLDRAGGVGQRRGRPRRRRSACGCGRRAGPPSAGRAGSPGRTAAARRRRPGCPGGSSRPARRRPRETSSTAARLRADGLLGVVGEVVAQA